MGYSKKQFIDAAFEEIGLARYTFDVSTEQEESALRLLDSMMAEWNASGIRIAYPLADPASSDITQATNVPDAAYEAIRTSLALKLAPQYGRQVMPATMKAAAQALQVLRARFAVPPVAPYRPGTPLGAGNRSLMFGRGPFIQNRPVLDAGPDQPLEFV